MSVIPGLQESPTPGRGPKECRGEWEAEAGEQRCGKPFGGKRDSEGADSASRAGVFL